MNNLRISLIQSYLHWENIPANLAMFSEKIDTLQPTDLIILPEMFSTGFSMNAQQLAEEMHGQSVQWMQKIARQKQCAVTGSLIITEEDSYYNRLVWVNPDGSVQTYDKRHLFSLSDEPKVFSPGSERLIVELKGWKICPLVCYDLRFPVWSRNGLNSETGEPQYDLLVYVANWPERRSHAWKSLLTARAIENQSYVVGVNRVGADASGINHTGDSMVIDALGKTIYHKADEEDIFTCELSYEELKKLRSQLPFLKDADAFVLNVKQKIKSH
ncbi:MAG TPA: amidohydrolase [Chitinophagales bacterium]|nr:amidohydrolase [Chitinophagales bacterium]